MPKTKISEFSATPANNTDIDSINISEGCAPSGINDAIRELMAQLKDWQSGTSNDPYVVGSSGSLTLNQGTANGVAYLNGSKVVTSGSALVFDGTNFGVGTSSPAQKLHVNGLAYIGGTSAQAGFIAGTLSGVPFLQGYDPTGANNVLAFYTNESERMRLNSTGLGIGTSSPAAKLQVTTSSSTGTDGSNGIRVNAGGSVAINMGADSSSGYGWIQSANWGNGYISTVINPNGGNLLVGTTTSSSKLTLDGTQTFRDGADSRVGTIKMSSGAFQIATNSSFELTFQTNATERARIDSSGNLRVGTTSTLVSGNEKVSIDCGSTNGLTTKTSGGASSWNYFAWNSATSGNNGFIEFGTEGTYTARGSITYNRAGGLTTYNTTSDYRAKDISGPVTGSGALIDSVPVYMGKMKGATQERPMFIAHETPAYAHTGEKDAVDADGNPVYQQMDASALIPVMWAEIQSLRKRLADAGI
jgi:hypothetical protein